MAGFVWCHEVVLELVCGACFWCSLHCKTSRFVLECFGGKVWRNSTEHRPDNFRPYCLQVPNAPQSSHQARVGGLEIAYRRLGFASHVSAAASFALHCRGSSCFGRQSKPQAICRRLSIEPTQHMGGFSWPLPAYRRWFRMLSKTQ